MKKAISLLLALLMCLPLCACGGDADADADADADTSAESNNPVASDDNVETKHIITDVEIFAGKILIEGVKCFKNPLSTKVKNVWVSSFNEKFYYFTYEIEVKNSAGIMESLYYGNSVSFSDLSDSTLDKAIKEIQTCNTLTALGSASSSLYFRENEIEAMQNGEALDANSIQEYFLKNYSK